MVITSFEIDIVADATNQRENACNKALTAHKVYTRVILVYNFYKSIRNFTLLQLLRWSKKYCTEITLIWAKSIE